LKIPLNVVILGAGFHPWFIAHMLLREAKALMDGQPSAAQIRSN
jgi:hypothetical protein